MHVSPFSNQQFSNQFQFSETSLRSGTNDSEQKQELKVSETSTSKVISGDKVVESYSEKYRQETRSFDGVKVFESVMSRSYQRVTTSDSFPAIEQHSIDPQSSASKKSSDNILGFIEAQIRRDVNNGASNDEIEARLETALTAFEKGFNEAKDELRAIGLLSQSVEDDIHATYDAVTSGIQDLKQQYVVSESNVDDVDSHQHEAGETAATDSTTETAPVNNDSAIVAPISESPASSEPAGHTEPSTNTISSLAQQRETFAADTERNILASLNTPSNSGLGSVDSFSNYQFAQSNTFSFEIETADGDKITVHANTKDLYAAEKGGGGYLSEVSEFTQGFQLTVDGELDEGELLALNELFDQVGRLSKEFFSGDLDAAFSQAQNLGYDTDEIVGFSLNLRQVEVERVRIAYDEFAPDNNQESNKITDALQPIGNFAQGLLDALRPANKFSDPVSLIQHLASYIEQVKINEEQNKTEKPDADKVAESTGPQTGASEVKESKTANEANFSSGQQPVNGENSPFDKEFLQSENSRFAPFIKTILESLQA